VPGAGEVAGVTGCGGCGGDTSSPVQPDVSAIEQRSAKGAASAAEGLRAHDNSSMSGGYHGSKWSVRRRRVTRLTARCAEVYDSSSSYS
jgi:hypothetical protein